MKVTSDFASAIQAKQAMQECMETAVKRFSSDTGINHSQGCTDVWFEMPGSPGRYASIGFDHSTHQLYWSIDKRAVQVQAIDTLVQKNGYRDEYKDYLYKNISLTEMFYQLDEAKQVSWIVKFIESELKELDKVPGPVY